MRSRFAIFLRLMISLVLLIGLLFGSAGRWDLPFFWAYIGAYLLVVATCLPRIDPELLQERLQPRPGGKDRHLRLLGLPFFTAHIVVAGLDAGRFHWSGAVPMAVQIGGLVGCVLPLGLTVWAMAVNRFFSPVVRIQEERGHHLITTGPYQFVRHPGYAGLILAYLSSGPALGSWWSMIPMTGWILLLLRRTLVEDRFLRENLAGYADYSTRVRSRLLPGIW